LSRRFLKTQSRGRAPGDEKGKKGGGLEREKGEFGGSRTLKRGIESLKKKTLYPLSRE